MFIRLAMMVSFLAVVQVPGCTTGGMKNRHPESESGRKEASSTEKSENDAAKEQAEKAAKHAKLARDLPIAKEEVVKAKAAIDLQQATNRDNLDKTQAERDLAEKKLKDLEEKHGPARLEKTRNGLLEAQDYHKEAEEELAQLEMMYKEADLADKTREIVIERAKRRLTRSQRELTVQQKELDNLEKATLPLEITDLRMQLTQKNQALEAAKRTAESDLRAKRIELMKAEAEVARIEAEMAELDKDKKP